MRFILSSFAILGLIFYELSGGADFQPRKPEAVEAGNKAEAENAPQRRPAAARIAAPARITSTALIAAPAIRQASAPDTVSVSDGAGLGRVRTSLRQGLDMMPDQPAAATLTLASLDLGAAGLGVAVAARPVVEPVAAYQPPPPDLREVTGTRVNMRDGPGTTYPVVARLNIGHQVEVLSDSGTGWLRLRILPERQLGWISASLISKPRR
ncbi:SH3 domain-containing protein [Sedimentitalea sp. HM32M-2]|uniref:SH3 domain-containing protein n=1 Tax=Sedimentitalea sp. HM32M-2 TaxID=3351566 RepID=UPI003642744C